jgi:hypothetical protein
MILVFSLFADNVGIIIKAKIAAKTLPKTTTIPNLWLGGKLERAKVENPTITVVIEIIAGFA